ncbi:enoyl-CoA hydratase/isomerase family protein, partial [Mesorhizobium sp. M1A.F.Ca.IN.022.07.1.1]|uniref:enoyl-CoA hydratase/isomerase family protein n=2 Tax=unclassified Mesorhizobium TaxID=325217 RepID=UPI000FD3FF35
MSKTVKVNIEASIATIVLARPDKLNALNGPMIAELGDAAVLIGKDASVRVAIITGSGKAFCTGGDIAAWSEIDSLSLGEDWVREGHRVFDALARLRVPLIAALNGSAFGGGLELAATAD